MKVTKTAFEGLLILEPKVMTDSRGYFYESYNKRAFRQVGVEADFVQENQSKSIRNVIRGLHFQNAPKAQSKLVRVLNGRILDVVVDLRRVQSTFGRIFSIELSSSESNQLFVPKGFAHGFSVLSDIAEILYFCDEYYAPECESGILYNDGLLDIDWGVPPADAIVSSKDLALPKFSPSSFAF